jgi:hypothetical protein
MTTYLADLIIFPARKTYFKRNVLICCLNSEMSRKSNLNSKNRMYESIIIYLYEPYNFEAINTRVQNYKPRSSEIYFLKDTWLLGQ